MSEAITPRQWLEENGPRTDDEAREAAEALLRARVRADELERLDALTPFESALAERAYRAGAGAVISLIEAHVGRAAETVRADALRQVLAHAGSGMEFRRHRDTPTAKWTSPANVRAAELVAGARHQAELEQPGVEQLTESERKLAAERDLWLSVVKDIAYGDGMGEHPRAFAQRALRENVTDQEA